MNDSKQLATVDMETGEIVGANGRHLPTQFKPQEAKARQVAIDAGIKFAAEIGDTSALERGAEEKVQHVADCVEWWKANVSANYGGARKKVQVLRTENLNVSDAEQVIGIRFQQISRWSKRLQDREKFKMQIAVAAQKKVVGDAAESSQLVQQSLSNEHYTPAKYLDAARDVLGGIDLDPASCLKANQIVRAERYFTAKDDGLAQSWKGRVWLNPPYGGQSGQFIAKLFEEFAAGNVTDAIVLVNSHCTDTAWFQPLFDGVLCFTNHRINFYGDVDRSGSTHGSVFAYFGDKREHFAETFSQFGSVVEKFRA